MPTPREIEKQARQALQSEPLVDLQRDHVRIDYEDGNLILQGEVPTVAAKKRALRRAAALPAVTGLIDRLRVRPASHMGDREIGDHLSRSLLREEAFSNCAIRLRSGQRVVSVQEPEDAVGWIEIEVEHGIVTLSGEVPSLMRKRLAGVSAWWIPGSRDVINGLGVTPDEDDSDDAVADAVSVVLAKDQFVDASQIRVGVRNAVVTLAGLVPAESEREMAEFDAWYVLGVDDVVNRIEWRA